MMKKERNKNNATEFNRKRAQIGSTLTWIGAFLIIFFILLLFLSASVVVSKTKKVLGVNYKLSAETIEQEPLMQLRMLVSLMNSRIEIDDNGIKRNIALKDVIAYLSLSEFEGYKEQIKNALIELARFEKPQCYLFRIISDEKSIIEFMDLFNAGGIRNSLSYQADVYSKAERIYISNIKRAGQIEIGLYAGRC